MPVVDRDGAEASGQPARFSPLRMVARALSAWQAASAPQGPDARPAPRPAADATPSLPLSADAPAAPASADSMLDIINAMLAADDETALPPEDADFDLLTLIGQAHDAFAPVAKGKGMTLALAVSPGACGLYQGDALRLRQALFNLISGALRATTEDALEVTTAWAGDALTFQVASPEAAAAMARVLAETKRPGPRRPATHRLALARTAALSLGGDMRATPGHGIEMTLPLRRVADAPTVAPQEEPHEEPALAPAPPPSGLRVLVAEQSAAHQQALTTLLAGMGLEAVVVSDGQELIEAWREQSWDAVLVDIEGEAICGLAVARSIRAAETVARWSRVPILALAATLKRRDLDEASAAAFDGLVAKPVHAASLQQAIEIALRAERTVPELRVISVA